MPPIEITNQPAETIESVEHLLEDNGEPTLQAVVIRDFLDGIDFTDLFDDEELQEFIDIEGGFAKFDSELDMYVECDQDDEGAEAVEIESIDGELLAELVDEEDLLAMFEYYLENEHGRETLDDRLRLAVFGYAEAEEDGDDDDLDEKAGGFKKGDFRKMYKAGAKDQVARMLLAMLYKEAIQRAKKGPGKGYKKGDYDKDPAGYAAGTPGGIKRWKKYTKKFAAKIAKAGKKAAKKKVTVGGKRIVAGKKKVVKKAAKKKAGVGAAKKKAQKKGRKGKKELAAHYQSAASMIDERLAKTIKDVRALFKAFNVLASARKNIITLIFQLPGKTDIDTVFRQLGKFAEASGDKYGIVDLYYGVARQITIEFSDDDMAKKFSTAVQYRKRKNESYDESNLREDAQVGLKAHTTLDPTKVTESVGLTSKVLSGMNPQKSAS